MTTSHKNSKIGYFKLTFKGELRLKKHEHSGHDTLTILYCRAATAPDEPTTACVHSSSKYVTFIRDLFENSKTIRIRPMSRKNLEFETKNLTPYGETSQSDQSKPQESNALPIHIPPYLETIFDRHQDAILEYANRNPRIRASLLTRPLKRQRFAIKTV